MNFRKTTTISIGEKTKPIFESLEKIRPSHLSYSLLLAIAVDEYVKNHSGKSCNIFKVSINDGYYGEMECMYKWIIK